MTNSDELYGTEGVSDTDVLGTEHSRAYEAVARGEVLGVLTGQVDVKSMPIATVVSKEAADLDAQYRKAERETDDDEQDA